jgi:diaminopimelate decarboxylase
MVAYDNGWKIEGVSVEEIAKKYGTPTYVYSGMMLEEAISKVYHVFEGLPFTLSYACKANGNPLLLNFLHKHGLWMDVVTMGEYQIARRAGVKPENIIVNGNGKTLFDLETWLEEGVFAINIDSQEEYSLIVENRLSGNDRTQFFLRVNPDVDAKTHPYISTGLKKNKFGIHLETAQKILEEDRLPVSGIHMHIGSSISEITPYAEAIEKLLRFKERNSSLQYLNIGGGWSIDYSHSGKEFDVSAFRQTIVPLLKSFDCPVIAELGRYIVGSAGTLLSKVMYLKQTPYKRFIVCDANMATLIRPALYGAEHIVLPLIAPEKKRKRFIVDVVGALCETGDILAQGREIDEVVPGELVAILDTGAYGYAMSSNYNGVFRPAEVLVQAENTRLIRRRETADDIMRLIE